MDIPGIGKINLPSPKAVVNTVKDAVVDKVGDAAGAAAKAIGEADLTSKVTGPLAASKLGLEALGKVAKGADAIVDKAGDLAGDAKDAFIDLVTPNHEADDNYLHAAGRSRIASAGDGAV